MNEIIYQIYDIVAPPWAPTEYYLILSHRYGNGCYEFMRLEDCKVFFSSIGSNVSVVHRGPSND